MLEVRSSACGGLQRLVAELLRPPLGVAAVEVVLDLRDVGAEVAFAAAELLLPLGDGGLSLLELLLADVVVGFEPRLAQEELALLLRDRRALRAAADRDGPAGRGPGFELQLALGERSLTGDDETLALEQATPLGLDLGLELGSRTGLLGREGACSGRLGAVQLRLARGELELALVELRRARGDGIASRSTWSRASASRASTSASRAASMTSRACRSASRPRPSLWFASPRVIRSSWARSSCSRRRHDRLALLELPEPLETGGELRFPRRERGGRLGDPDLACRDRRLALLDAGEALGHDAELGLAPLELGLGLADRPFAVLELGELPNPASSWACPALDLGLCLRELCLALGERVRACAVSSAAASARAASACFSSAAFSSISRSRSFACASASVRALVLGGDRLSDRLRLRELLGCRPLARRDRSLCSRELRVALVELLDPAYGLLLEVERVDLRRECRAQLAFAHRAPRRAPREARPRPRRAASPRRSPR